MILEFFQARAKAFAAAFLAGIAAAVFAGAEAAGFPLSDAIKASITMLLTGWIVSNTANTFMSNPGLGWGANIKEFIFQLFAALLAYFGIGAIAPTP